MFCSYTLDIFIPLLSSTILYTSWLLFYPNTVLIIPVYILPNIVLLYVYIYVLKITSGTEVTQSGLYFPSEAKLFWFLLVLWDLLSSENYRRQ